MIIRAGWHEPGVKFLTEDSQPMQMGLMCHPKGYVIRPHAHIPAERVVTYTQEVLFIRKGRLRVDFYDDARRIIDERTLASGDVILLAAGGHGFEALEDLEMIEAKTGPFMGEKDKVRFDPAAEV